MVKKNILTIIFYTWIAALFVLNLISFSKNKVFTGQNNSGFRLDYVEHFLFYGILPVLYILADKAYLEKLSLRRGLLLFIGFSFCVITEVLQYFIPGRTFNPIDLGLNLAGFITGILIAGRFEKKS